MKPLVLVVLFSMTQEDQTLASLTERQYGIDCVSEAALACYYPVIAALRGEMGMFVFDSVLKATIPLSVNIQHNQERELSKFIFDSVTDASIPICVNIQIKVRDHIHLIRRNAAGE